MSKVIIVGGVAGGLSAALRERRLNEKAEIIVFEKGNDIGFSNCALPYYLSGEVEDSSNLIMMNPQRLKKQYNVEARVNSEVIDIDKEKKTVLVKDKDKEYLETYDTLILSPGASAIIPNIEGKDNSNVFSLRNVEDVIKIKEYIGNNNVNNVAIIGGGFIGIEVAENLAKLSKSVSLIEASNQVLGNYDEDMVQIIHKELLDNNIDLILNDSAKAIYEDHLLTSKGKKIKAEIVIMAIGVRANSELALKAGLDIGEKGIKVNKYYQSSDKDIYCIGDAIEVTNAISKDKVNVALAYPAQLQARKAINHLNGIEEEEYEYNPTSALRVFSLFCASTGLNEKQLKNKGIEYDYVYLITNDKVSIMPNSKQLHLKLIYDLKGTILGAQAIGSNNADRRIDIVATLMKYKGNVKDLINLQLAYTPTIATSKDIVNLAGMVADNLLNNSFKQVKLSEVRDLVNSNEVIIDVREKSEYEKGHIINAINIPLSEIRERYNEIPKDRNVYLHCRSSQRSYNAIMFLQQVGFNNLYNISGSFLGLSYYEYVKDLLEKREKIVTNYNFN